MSLAPYFTKNYWRAGYPVWQDYDAWRSLGLPDIKAEYQPSKVAVQPVAKAMLGSTPAPVESSAFSNLFFGLLMGLFSYTLVVKRQVLIDHARKLIKNQR